MRHFEKRISKLESKHDADNRPWKSHIVPYTFDVEEDKDPIIEEYCRREGIDLENTRNIFRCLIRSLNSVPVPKHGWDDEYENARKRLTEA